jgi:hypothetical protein
MRLLYLVQLLLKFIGGWKSQEKKNGKRKTITNNKKIISVCVCEKK